MTTTTTTALTEFDRVTTELVRNVFSSVPMADWERVSVVLKSTPDGSVRTRSYDFHLPGGVVDRGSSPEKQADRQVDSLAATHWRLTRELGQPRWYKMIVTVERSGKYGVAFEYNDAYREGDIIGRG